MCNTLASYFVSYLLSQGAFFFFFEKINCYRAVFHWLRHGYLLLFSRGSTVKCRLFTAAMRAVPHMETNSGIWLHQVLIHHWTKDKYFLYDKLILPVICMYCGVWHIWLCKKAIKGVWVIQPLWNGYFIIFQLLLYIFTMPEIKLRFIYLLYTSGYTVCTRIWRQYKFTSKNVILKSHLHLCMYAHRICQWGRGGFSCSGASEFGMGQLCCGHCVRYCWCCRQREESSCGKKSFVCVLLINKFWTDFHYSFFGESGINEY